MRTQFIVIGIPDDPNYISKNKKIVDIINGNTYFSGGKRHHEILMPFLPEGAVWIDIKVPLDKVFDEYEYHQKIVVFASGDPLFYDDPQTDAGRRDNTSALVQFTADAFTRTKNILRRHDHGFPHRTPLA